MNFKSKSRFGAVFGRTWDNFFINFWKFFWVAVVLSLVSIVAIYVLKWIFNVGEAIDTMATVGGLLMLPVSIVLGGVLVAGVYHVAKGAHGGGNVPGVGESLVKGFAGWWKYTLMILRLIWFVMWPVLVAFVVFFGVWWLVWGGTPQASAQAPDGVTSSFDVEALGDFDFSKLPAGSDSFSSPALGGGLGEQFLPLVQSFIGANKGSIAFGGLGLLVITFLIIWRTVQAAFSFVVLTDKNIGVNEALMGSLEAVKGRWWRIFGSLFFLYLLTAGLFLLVAVLGGMLSIAVTWVLDGLNLMSIAGPVGEAIVTLLVTGFSAGIGVLFHYELYKA